MKGQNDLYDDFLSLFDRYKHFLSFLEEILLWEDHKKSIVIYILIQLTFWQLLYFPYSYLFLVSMLSLLYFVYETLSSALKFSLFQPRSSPPRILNSEKMALYASKTFSFIFSVSNKLIRFRNVTPIGFYLLALALGAGLIQLSYYINGVTIAYSLLNALLIIPVVRFHQIHVTFWLHLKPYIEALEKEFDKRQLEDPKEADEQETRIASEICFNGERICEENSEEFYDWVDSVCVGTRPLYENSDHELSFSEEILSKKNFMNKSRAKNDETLAIITKDLMKSSEADNLSYWIDRFMEGTENLSEINLDDQALRKMMEKQKSDAWSTSSTDNEFDIFSDDDVGMVT